MYYFYIIQAPNGRVGFGIASAPNDRIKKYTSHCGEIVEFPFLFGGMRCQAKSLEKIIKREYVDNLWVIENWKTEWLNLDITLGEFHNYVKELISERHIRVELVATSFNFLSELPLTSD